MSARHSSRAQTRDWSRIKAGDRVRVDCGGLLTEWITVATTTKVREELGANGIYEVVVMPLHPDDADFTATFERRGNNDVWVML